MSTGARKLRLSSGYRELSTTPLTLTAAPNGGCNPWQLPGALQVGGTTYIGYVDGSGNVEVITYDGSVSGPYTIHSGFEADAHTSPAFVRRASDGRFITVYSKHNATPINLRVATNPDDVSAWGSATDLDAQLTGTRYTDEQIWEYGSTLYLFYRDEPSAGTDSRWCLSTCASGSPTTGWAAQTQIYRVASARSYVVNVLDSTRGRIHFVATNSTTKLGHFYLDIAAGTYHKSDGTQITASKPYNFSHITEIMTGTSTVYPSNVVVDGDGYPVVGIQDLNVAGDIRYHYARWNGSAWNDTDVASSGTGYEYSGLGTGFGSWGYCVDDGNPNIFWTIGEDGSQPEIYRHLTRDGGSTFTTTQVTTGTTSDQQQLICVRNPINALRALWQIGTWTDYTDWSVGLMGVSLG